eukprot:1181803-Prorocentrum_minimum.AAC.2
MSASTPSGVYGKLKFICADPQKEAILPRPLVVCSTLGQGRGSQEGSKGGSEGVRAGWGKEESSGSEEGSIEALNVEQHRPRGRYRGPRGRYRGPRGRYRGPRGRYRGPRGRYRGPRGRYRGPRGRYRGPRGRYSGPSGAYPTSAAPKKLCRVGTRGSTGIERGVEKGCRHDLAQVVAACHHARLAGMELLMLGRVRMVVVAVQHVAVVRQTDLRILQEAETMDANQRMRTRVRQQDSSWHPSGQEHTNSSDSPQESYRGACWSCARQCSARP